MRFDPSPLCVVSAAPYFRMHNTHLTDLSTGWNSQCIVLMCLQMAIAILLPWNVLLHEYNDIQPSLNQNLWTASGNQRTPDTGTENRDTNFLLFILFFELPLYRRVKSFDGIRNVTKSLSINNSFRLLSFFLKGSVSQKKEVDDGRRWSKTRRKNRTLKVTRFFTYDPLIAGTVFLSVQHLFFSLYALISFYYPMCVFSLFSSSFM